MSHFTKIRTELREEKYLLKALEDLGHRYLLDAEIRGWGGQRMRVRVAIPQPNGYDIGFKRQDEGFEMVADLWGLKVDKDQFLQQVQQRYAYHAILDQAQTEGFRIVSEERLDDGSIRLVCEREVEEAQA
ncbi:MAG: DUF1257 domain-containing protein [Armatimonadetes bacterium]|nr:DUF1257 domain-containing protein [Armatimonadota bacterium]